MKRTIFLAALAATLLTAPAARAIDVPVTFDYAVLDTPATPNAEVVTPDGPPITATVALDEATGNFTIAPAAFDFPQYNFSDPIPGSIEVILNAPATGKVDLNTGQVDMTANFQAQVQTSFGNCNIDTGPQQLSTEKTQPLAGRRFPSGGNAGLVSGPGALTVDWPSLPPGTGPGCSLIDPFIGGPGGFWVSKGIDPSPTSYDVAKLGLSVKPKSKAVKGGKSATFRAKVSNTTDSTAATEVEICAKAPKPGGKVCSDVGTLEPGQSKTVPFKVNAPKAKKKPKSYKIAFTATGEGVKAGKASATLVVKKKK